MNEPIIVLDRLQKRFGAITALDGVSLEVNSSEVFGFIGPNGAGKTTAIRCMLGFYRPDGGVVRLFGEDPRTDFERIGPRLGVMLDAPGLNTNLTAIEYLEYFAGLFGMPRREARGRIDDLLERVGLAARGHDRIATYSKGMRQRVTLARCLLNHPRVLILDEPFDGIDAETRRDILGLIPAIAADDEAAVFITSHNLHEVERICDRVAIVKSGRTVAMGRVSELLESRSRRQLVVELAPPVPRSRLSRVLPEATFDPASSRLTVDCSARNGSTRDHVLRTLFDNEISIVSVQEVRPSLEDVYFEIVEAGGEKS